MREANRAAFVGAAVSADPGIELLQPPFKFSRDGADLLTRLSDDDRTAISETFEVVGGEGELDTERLDRFVRRLGSDDRIRIDGDKFVVEYDERSHFTTFRALTLDSSLYSRLRVGFDPADYRSACGVAPMAKTSGFAHNSSAHRHFKCPHPTVPWECRHRQRAFYDYLKDVLFGLRLAGVPRLIRVSDLEGGTLSNPQASADLLRRRARWATRA